MDLQAWLDTRRPAPPADLRLRVEEAVTEALRRASSVVHHGEPGGEGRSELLFLAAQERLQAAVARPGRVRASAFELLVADALITYACEAALETERPSEVLERLVEVGRTR